MHDIIKVNYCINRKRKMLNEFNKRFSLAKKSLENIYSLDKIEKINKQCILEFEILLEEIPFIEYFTFFKLNAPAAMSDGFSHSIYVD